jgi:hypothetical protein
MRVMMLALVVGVMAQIALGQVVPPGGGSIDVELPEYVLTNGGVRINGVVVTNGSDLTVAASNATYAGQAGTAQVAVVAQDWQADKPGVTGGIAQAQATADAAVPKASTNTWEVGSHAGLLPKSGGTMTGAIDMGTNAIVGHAFGFGAGFGSSVTLGANVGDFAGIASQGAYNHNFGYYSGYGLISSYSAVFGTYAGRNARGDSRMYLSVYPSDPSYGAGDATNDCIFQDNDGTLYLGFGAGAACGFADKGVRLRGPVYGDISACTGLTAAQVAAAGGVTQTWQTAVVTVTGTNQAFALSESARHWKWLVPVTNVTLTPTFTGPASGASSFGRVSMYATNCSVAWPAGQVFYSMTAPTRTTNAPAISFHNEMFLDWSDGTLAICMATTNGAATP